MQCGPSLRAELATGWPLGPVMWFLEEGGGRAGTSLRGRGRWALLRAGPCPGPPRGLRAQPRPGAGPRLLGAVGCGQSNVLCAVTAFLLRSVCGHHCFWRTCKKVAVSEKGTRLPLASVQAAWPL